jgi:type II secretory pathway pseudopilin PulG
MIMVMSIIGFIAAIAAPRFSSAADQSRDSAVRSDVRNLQFAVEMYAAEHFDRSPAENADGSTQSDGTVVVSRLLQMTDDSGNVNPAGPYGPYLRSWPVNPYTGKTSLRVDPSGAPKGTDGWVLTIGARSISSDAQVLTAAATPPDNSLATSGGATSATSPASVD